MGRMEIITLKFNKEYKVSKIGFKKKPKKVTLDIYVTVTILQLYKKNCESNAVGVTPS